VFAGSSIFNNSPVQLLYSLLEEDVTMTDLSIVVIKGLIKVAEIPAAAISPSKTAGNLLPIQSPS
jgi:hypothetical protein